MAGMSFAGIIVPSLTVSANKGSFRTNHVQGQSNVPVDNSLVITDPSNDFLPTNLAQYATIDYNESTDETTVAITDYHMRQLLIKEGVSPAELGHYGFTRSNGVTKIIWHGKARHGNVDLYLSRNTMVMYHALSGAAGLVAIIVEAYFGQYASAAKQFGKVIAETIAAGNTHNGKVFSARHWTDISVHNQ